MGISNEFSAEKWAVRAKLGADRPKGLFGGGFCRRAETEDRSNNPEWVQFDKTVTAESSSYRVVAFVWAEYDQVGALHEYPWRLR